MRNTATRIDDIQAGFMKPVELAQWPELVTLAVEWPYDVLAYSGEGPVFEIGES